MDANTYYLNQHLAQEDAEDIRQTAINERADDIQLELLQQFGDFQEALFNALESSELLHELHEKFVEGRRKDFGIDMCEKIDDALSEMAMGLAKGEFE